MSEVREFNDCVIVYTKEGCAPCMMTERVLSKYGVPYDAISLDRVEEAREAMKAMGVKQAPVVTYKDIMWSGFRPDKIKEVAALFK